MAALRDLIEVYGALDQAVATSDDPATARALDAFVPGASANRGWYRSLETFFFSEQARTEPNLVDALQRIGTAADQAALTAPQKSRLYYGLGVATRVRAAAPAARVPSLAGDDFDGALAGALAAVGPATMNVEQRHQNAATWLSAYQDGVRTYLAGRENFVGFRHASAGFEVVDPAIDKIPLCSAALATVDGIRAVVVDTNLHADDIPLDSVKKIVNPFNWDNNYPDFFISMTKSCPEDRTDGWRRVLETVGFRDLGSRQLCTALKYRPAPDCADGSVRLDYDLDDPVPNPGNGYVTVDRGYINMWPDNEARDPAQPGVRIRTRKVVHINGLDPYAQLRLVCLTGYGTASQEFLLGPARSPSADALSFDYYEFGQDPAEQAPVEPGKANHVGTVAVKMFTESLEGFTGDYFDLTQKWLGGNLTTTDLATYTSAVAGRIAGAPWEFLRRINQPRYPGREGDGQ